MTQARDVVYRFFNLPWHVRVKIMLDLGLTDEQEVSLLRDAELIERAFRRARDRGLMADLKRRIRDA